MKNVDEVIVILGDYNQSIINELRNIKNINEDSFDFLKNKNIEIHVETKEDAYYDAFEFLLDMINLIDPLCDVEDQQQFKYQCSKMGVKVRKDGQPHFKSLIKFVEINSRMKHIFM